MVQLQRDNRQIKAAGLQVVGVSYDSVKVLGDFAKKRKVNLTLLADKDSKIIDAYQVRNKSAKGRTAGIPHPVTIIVDQQGVIRAKLPGTVRRRHTTQALLDAAKKLKE